MTEFWKFALGALHYRRLLLMALAAALLDAAFAFAGFGSLLLVIKQLLGENQNVRDLVGQALSHPSVTRVIGPPGPWLDYVPTDPFLGFAFLLLVIFVIACMGAAARYAHQSLVITVTLRTAMRIRRQVYDRLIRGPVAVLLTQGTADHLSRVTRDCTLITRGMQSLMGKSVQSITMGTVALSWAMIANWKLTTIFLLMLPVNYKLIRQFGKTVRRAAKNTNREYGAMTASLQESLQASPVVKVHQAEGYERRRFSKVSRRVLGHELHSRTAKAMSGPLVELVAIIGTMLVALVAAYLVYRQPGGASPHELVQVLLLLGGAGVAFKPLTGLNNDLQEAAGSATRIDEVLKLPVEPTAKEQRHQPALPRHAKSILFDSISYAYPKAEREAISDIDLDVKHGLTVAVVGPNGSGKSTLLSLVPRLLEPTRGRILIDGHDIAKMSLRSLRRQIAMVTQQSVLFEGTIAENIAYGRRHESMDRIVAAAKQAYADDFVRALPNGYHSTLGELGSGLSGGQRQRLCIARAILRDPTILILDEATSQIDAESEAKINKALRHFRHGRTTFVIAHRLSTVIDADLIVVMHDGRINDMGTHDMLLKRCAIYKLLTHTQLQASA